MLRNIVNIDQEKCNGCGLCVSACHERAIVLNEQGKAELVKEDYCDGLGDCLPACPMNAIKIEQRETVPYDEEAVKARIAQMDREMEREDVEQDKNEKKSLLSRLIMGGEKQVGGCPGSMARNLHMNGEKPAGGCPGSMARTLNDDAKKVDENTGCVCHQEESNDEFSMLSHWPVQIRLAASKAEYFEGADLLVAADCSAYAYGNFHNKFMKDRVTVVGCPKLDDYDYEEKFYEIFMQNNVRSVTLVRMEVPCCGAMERAVLRALERCGKLIPKQVVILSLGGEILSR